jgi:hypothetical protein
MRKLGLFASVAVIALGTAGSAQAWDHHRHHYRSSGWNNGGALAAGLIGGAVLGSLLTAATSPAWGWGYPAYGYAPTYGGYYAAPAAGTRVVYTTAPTYAYGYPYAGYGYAAPVRTRVVYRPAPATRVVYAQPRTRVVYQQPRARVIAQPAYSTRVSVRSNAQRIGVRQVDRQVVRTSSDGRRGMQVERRMQRRMLQN